MSSSLPKAIYLADYQVPNYWVDKVNLQFDLGSSETRVHSVLSMRRNPDANGGACILDGEALELISVTLNGKILTADDYQVSASQLIIASVPKQFELAIETRIYPDKNTALEGLYHSGKLLSTQCEAEGFRRITYYPDRPDVLAVFTVSIVGDSDEWPIMLANGNLESQGLFDDGRHWVRWHDPHPKPAYLFALVAGPLHRQQDTFITMSGKTVSLALYVEPENAEKCDHAMASLKQAMKWDEQRYGREYDLDVFMIVAVNDFNMGAMENKGLNIFNASCVLASPETATDDDYHTIQSIVGHEYFHNWSGNRVTCRDWFQLSLKEGFTVFRDQQFSADMHSQAVQRINDVNQLRTLQFAEDASPMAHPVQPASFIEISNFYTVTIYEKGAEVVRMLQTIVGEAGFRRATDRYFSQFDGQAVTIEDFVSVIAEENDIDLSQFMQWYRQAGTPTLHVTTEYKAQQQQVILTMTQSCDTINNSPALPFHIPIAVGLLDKTGKPMKVKIENTAQQEQETVVLSLTQSSQQFVLAGVKSEPIVSVLRDFSAPVKLTYQRDTQALLLLAQYDKDGFSRWDASQHLLLTTMLALIERAKKGQMLRLPDVIIAHFASLLEDEQADPALIAKMLTLPSENYLATQMKPVEVMAIHQVVRFITEAVARQLNGPLLACYQRLSSDRPYSFDADAMAKRSLKNQCLLYLTAVGDETAVKRCMSQLTTADNMTDMLAALHAISHYQGEERSNALEYFYQRWQGDKQVMDKWFAVQARSPLSDTLQTVKQLMTHEKFNIKNPNNVRALIGQFCRNNPVCFHASDGSGYDFLAEQVIALDKLNPQIAARQLGALGGWQQYDTLRQQKIQAALTQIAEQEGLSADVYEIVNKYRMPLCTS